LFDYTKLPVVTDWDVPPKEGFDVFQGVKKGGGFVVLLLWVICWGLAKFYGFGYLAFYSESFYALNG
jgi:hypothetical protein